MSKGLRNFESEAKYRMTKCKNTRKDKESEVLKLIDEQAFQLTLELAKSKKAREATEDQCAEDISGMLERLESELASEIRFNGSTILSEEIEKHVTRCTQEIEAERQAREETENSMRQMIAEMEATLRSEIDEERAQRQASEEGFMNLLEETCSRIERNLLN